MDLTRCYRLAMLFMIVAFTQVNSFSFFKILSTVNDVIDTGRAVTGFLEDALSSSNSLSIGKHRKTISVSDHNGRSLLEGDIDFIDFYPYVNLHSMTHIDDVIEEKYSDIEGVGKITVESHELEENFNSTFVKAYSSYNCGDYVDVSLNLNGVLSLSSYRPFESLYSLKKIIYPNSSKLLFSKLDDQREKYYPICTLPKSYRYLSTEVISVNNNVVKPTFETETSNSLKLYINGYGQAVPILSEFSTIRSISVVQYVCKSSSHYLPRMRFSKLYLINPCSSLLCTQDGKLFLDHARVWSGIVVYECPDLGLDTMKTLTMQSTPFHALCDSNTKFYIALDGNNQITNINLSTISGIVNFCIQMSKSELDRQLASILSVSGFHTSRGALPLTTTISGTQNGGTIYCCKHTVLNLVCTDCDLNF